VGTYAFMELTMTNLGYRECAVFERSSADRRGPNNRALQPCRQQFSIRGPAWDTAI